MLKKKQVIRWKDAIGGNQYKENEAGKPINVITEAALAAVCVLVFMLSSRIMLEDVFLWGEFSGGSVVVAFFLLAIVCGVMEVSYYIKKEYGVYVRWGVLLAGAVIAFLYILLDTDDNIASGLLQTGEQYMKYWNRYYSGVGIKNGGEIGNIETALNFVFLWSSFAFLWIARMTRKNIILVASPILILCMELLVGYAPNELGVFLMFLGIIVANASKWTKSDFVHSFGRKRRSVGVFKHFMWVAVFVGAMSFYGIVKLLAGTSAEDMTGKSKEFKTFQEDLISDITNWSVWEMFGAVADSGILTGDWSHNDSYKDKLTNKPLKYDNETVLTFETSQRIYSNIYIRGFYANIYDDGVWELDYDAFEVACEDAGYDVDEMSNNILGLGTSKLILNDNVNKEWCSATVKYVDADSERAFYPYFVHLTDEENVYAEGDGRYRKEDDIEELSFNMWSRESLYEYYVYTFDSITKYGWEIWYEDFVMDHYTKAPDDMPMVSKIASIIQEQVDWNLYGYDDINDKRLGVADELVKWFNGNTRYTKQPPELPSGADPVEYFLGTSKEGYCMHYASSAVLILRTMGIPARYATGYVVDSDLFKKTGSVYVAEIPDSRAHAWVEIYLEGIGWVPVEVTNGYDITNLDNLGEEDETSTSEDIIDDETSQDLTTPADEETSSEEPTTTVPDEDNDDTDDEIDEEIGYGNVDGSKTTKTGGGAFKVILICLLVAGLSGGVVYIIMRKKVLYNERLLREIKRKRTVRAIRNINRRIYRKVRIDAKIFKSNLRDDEYAEALKKTYTDITEKEWGRFMVVVKAATFSDIDLAEKEMDFCYDVYKRVMKKE